MEIRRVHQGDSLINLREEVERSVSAAITSGELSPGTLVTVPSLAAQFSVSATPVREAMVNLQKRGSVVPVPNKGFRVTEVSDTELIEICQLREWLECPAVERIAQNFPKHRVKDFRQLADRIVQAVDEGDLAGFVNAEATFHDELMALTNNDSLVQTLQMLRQRMRVAGLAARMETAELRLTASEHHRIIDLLLDGDEAGVSQLTREHVWHLALGAGADSSR